MPPRTRKSVRASSSKATVAVPNIKQDVADDKPINTANTISNNSNDHDAKINVRMVVEEDEEDMEPVDVVDEDVDGDSASETKGQSQKTDHRQVYAVGGGGYNSLKTYNGQVYSGMAIGGSHTWNYDQGVWKETKVEPDRWEIDYKTTKRRARKAPKGSGVPVGTQYHWFIVGHQYVEKLDDNTYQTHLVGSKYKLAHKSSSAASWSVPTVKGQREREIELLEDAKRRVEGLPPVLGTEKAKVGSKQEKGQQTLDTLFTKHKGDQGKNEPRGRKRRKVESEDV